MAEVTVSKSGWVIESGPGHAPIYFTNSWGPPPYSDRPEWTTDILKAYFWKSPERAESYAIEWNLKEYRVREHMIG